MKNLLKNHCVISVREAGLTGLSGKKRNLYKIEHAFSHNSLQAVSQEEAIEMSRLLDLDYSIWSIIEQLYSGLPEQD